MENPLWMRLWTSHEIDYGMNKRDHLHSSNCSRDNGFTVAWMQYPPTNMFQKIKLGPQEGLNNFQTRKE